ncbi:hypothetical protein [Cryptosporangium phraense]|uniref:hypothetical protein n=1 Tax=Cryptosporangium phraense TaxID=2593070 RepID=UPI00197AC4EA|nr:hypothetical protein [Cryptosporangium phraense]
MILGYSFWGFLGSGVVDTPDGGRSHRRALIDGLRERGHRVVFLQANRDRDEAHLDLTPIYDWDAGYPDIDVLFLEWRWPIPGRNTTTCGTPGHTCDLHRQQQLLDVYSARGVPVLLWDKDRQLPAEHPIRRAPAVAVCEPALHPAPGAVSLLFPVADEALDGADPVTLTKLRRDLPLVYIGNQYDRDEAFDRHFAPAARRHTHLIAGKWPRSSQWSDLNFAGRIAFDAVDRLYRRSVATVLLLPDRYASVGHMTQRLFEAVLAGCLPLTPATIREASRFTPRQLHISDGDDAANRLEQLLAVVGEQDHAEVLHACLARLDQFRLSRQLDTVEHTLTGLALRRVG